MASSVLPDFAEDDIPTDYPSGKQEKQERIKEKSKASPKKAWSVIPSSKVPKDPTLPVKPSEEIKIPQPCLPLFEKKANLVHRVQENLVKTVSEAQPGDLIELTPSSQSLLPIKAGLTYLGLGEVNVFSINFEGLADKLTQIIGLNFVISGPLNLNRALQFERCSFRFSSVKSAKDVLIDCNADLTFNNCIFKAGYHLAQKNLVVFRVQKGCLTCLSSEFKFETLAKSQNFFFQLASENAKLILQTNRFFVIDAGGSQHCLIEANQATVLAVANVGIWSNVLQTKSTFISGLKENNLNQFLVSPESLWN